MPSVRAITKIVDGLSVTRSNGVVATLTRSIIPTAQRNDPALVKAFVENWLLQQGWYGVCRVNAVNPLDVSVMFADRPGVVPADIFTRSSQISSALSSVATETVNRMREEA
jgi:hypothetical protein